MRKSEKDGKEQKIEGRSKFLGFRCQVSEKMAENRKAEDKRLRG